MSDEVKRWRCPNRHVMGMVARNGSGIRQLLLYRAAIEDQQPGDEIDVIAVVEGYAADVRCSLCGAVRTWIPGQEALERLLARVLEPQKDKM